MGHDKAKLRANQNYGEAGIKSKQISWSEERSARKEQIHGERQEEKPRVSRERWKGRKRVLVLDCRASLSVMFVSAVFSVFEFREVFSNNKISFLLLV